MTSTTSLRPRDVASAFTHCVRDESVMPDCSILVVNSQPVSPEAQPDAALDPIEVLSREFESAKSAIDDTTNGRSDARDTIHAMYPRAPDSIVRHFQIERCRCHLDWPAPLQAKILEDNLDKWLAQTGGADSEPARRARALLDEWKKWNGACNAIYSREGGPGMDALDEMLGAQFDLASERFIEASTTSQIGILLKLELAAYYGEFEEELKESPKLALNRIVLGLIRDLKTELGRS